MNDVEEIDSFLNTYEYRSDLIVVHLSFASSMRFIRFFNIRLFTSYNLKRMKILLLLLTTTLLRIVFFKYSSIDEMERIREEIIP